MAVKPSVDIEKLTDLTRLMEALSEGMNLLGHADLKAKDGRIVAFDGFDFRALPGEEQFADLEALVRNHLQGIYERKMREVADQIATLCEGKKPKDPLDAALAAITGG